MTLTIAIDGPVGAGKSTVAQAVADRLGVLHLDTGALYRAAALKLLRLGVDPYDEAQAMPILSETDLKVSFWGGKQHTIMDGEDVSHLIRTEAVSAGASAVSTCPEVRAYMLALQRRIASTSDMVVDGRDIGTRVLPNATHKFFLTADPGVRARRRHEEMLLKGVESHYEQVLADLNARDEQDANRAVDPLRPAADAHLVDSTGFNQEQVVDHMLAIINAPGAKE